MVTPSRLTRQAAAWLWLTIAAGVPAAAEDSTPPTVEQLVESVRPAVVTIRHTGRGERDAGLGTGFVIAADGLIATNLHVIGEARPISVELADGRSFDVTTVHASDRAADLAIIRIETAGLTPLPLAEPDSLADGQEVVAVGNPHGFERSVVTGRVSGQRDIDGVEMIQLAIPIESGNSGGPLLDRAGRRTMLFIGVAGMSLSLFLLGAAFLGLSYLMNRPRQTA